MHPVYNRVYKMPEPQTNSERVELSGKSISDILLIFEKYPQKHSRGIHIPKVVTVPYANSFGVMACQVYLSSSDYRSIVLTPEEDFYEFDLLPSPKGRGFPRR